jgi:hypothetical protein
MSAGNPVLPEVKCFNEACAKAVDSYNKFMVDGVKKYCSVARKDFQAVKQLANDMRKKALETRTAAKGEKEKV